MKRRWWWVGLAMLLLASATGLRAQGQPGPAPAKVPGYLFLVDYAHSNVMCVRDGIWLENEWRGVETTIGGAPGGIGLAAVLSQAAEEKARSINLLPRGAVGGLAVSPDGKYLFVSSQRYKKGSFLYDLQKGGEPVRKLKVGGEDPDFFPDGSAVVLIAYTLGEPHLAVVDLGTSNERPLGIREVAENPSWPKVSPDGKRLLYQSGVLRKRTTRIVDLATQSVAVLLEESQGAVHPAWSPDGGSVYYASLSDQQIHVLHLADKRDETLTTGTMQKLYPVPAKDGRSLLFVQSLREPAHKGVGGEFRPMYMDLASRQVAPVAVPNEPKWLSTVSPVLWQLVPAAPAKAAEPNTAETAP